MESLTPQQFIQKLQQAYPDLTTKDIAEILWLAQQIKETPSLEQATDLPPLQGDELALSTDVLSQKIATPHPTPGTNEPLPSLSERDEFHHRFQKFDASDSDYRAGYPIKSPTGSAMPGELELARSLRPLLHKVPSRTSRRLNVTATALRIAETEKKVLMPILQPDSQRWLDVALVIDTGASMIIWQDTIKELKALLEHLGAFRNVRAWYLATDDRQEAVLLADSGPAISLYYPANQEPSIGIDEKLHRRSAGELIDPSKQRLILVVTDCVSPSWHSGKVQELIRLWGQQNIVTIVQMLPRPLWRRTALGYADIVQVHAPSPGCINTRLTLRHAFSWFDDEQRPLPIPVFTLEPGSVGGWAKMIIGAPGSWATGVIFPPLSTEGSSLPVRQHDPQPATRVAQFRAASSSTSVKLAGLLSAAPISLPVIRLIQRALLPNSNQVHLAEVLLSGLLKKIPSNETIEDPNDVEYDFLPGVRELLLDPVPLAYSIEVLEKTSVLVAQHYGENREFKALAVPTLPLAEAAEQIPISPRSRRFALIAAAVWRGAGGSYVDWADKIQEKAQHVEEEEFDFNITNNHDSTIFSPNKTLIDVTDPIPETVAANATEPVPSIVSTSPDEKKEQISIPPTSFIPLPRDLSYQERPGEFEAVDRLLGSRQAERPRVIAISGMAGIGKTHMVIELAHQYVERERFPGGVFWMSEPGPSIFDWQRELARLAVVTGFLPSDDGSSITTNEQWRAQRFSQYLANRDDALLILDNVEYPELIAPMLSSLAGEMPTCAILYTSRHTEIPPGTRHYTVPSLPEAAALRLLLSGNKHSRVLEDITLGRTDAETDSARSLCRFVGYLPLALIHLRGQLEEDIRLTLVVLARELIREKAPDALEPLFRTLRLSWGYLDAQARDMFKRAVCFPEAQPLPLWLLGMVSGLGV
ncbi:MAG: SAV_2336 N-terminal domain-related protein, partial [Ktedonobacteraceae bacterium]